MNVQFLRAWDATLGAEMGFVDHPDDRGGPTRWGITQRVARANGYQGPMQDLPIDRAQAIAKAQFWDVIRLDDVGILSERVAVRLFDIGYHKGPATAAQFLQRCLNAFNLRGAFYSDVRVDGLVGPMTIAALRAFMSRRGVEGEAVLIRAITCLHGADFIRIAEGDPSQESFVYGWIRARAGGV